MSSTTDAPVLSVLPPLLSVAPSFNALDSSLTGFTLSTNVASSIPNPQLTIVAPLSSALPPTTVIASSMDEAEGAVTLNPFLFLSDMNSDGGY